MVLSRLALSYLLKRANSRLVLFASVAVAACGAFLLRQTEAYEISLLAVVLIGAGLAAAFPVVLGYIGDRHPLQSGTAFSTIFVLALVGNMAINKTFGYVAQQYGIEQYPLALITLLAISAVMLSVMNSRPQQ
jgi:fucose permease